MLVCGLGRLGVSAQASTDYGGQPSQSPMSPLSVPRKLGDGLFLQCCREVAARYPQITFENMIVDNTTMQVVTAGLRGLQSQHPDPLH